MLAQVTNPALRPELQGLTGSGFLGDLIPRLITLGFIAGIVIFFFILLIGAIQWIMSGGDKAAVESAKGKISNAIIGLVILLSIFAIIVVIENFFGIDILQIDLGPLEIGNTGTQGGFGGRSGASGGSGGTAKPI